MRPSIESEARNVKSARSLAAWISSSPAAIRERVCAVRVSAMDATANSLMDFTLKSVERRGDLFQSQVDFKLTAMMRGVREHVQQHLPARGRLAAFPVDLVFARELLRGQFANLVDGIIEPLASHFQHFILGFRLADADLRLGPADLLHVAAERRADVDHHHARSE